MSLLIDLVCCAIFGFVFFSIFINFSYKISTIIYFIFLFTENHMLINLILNKITVKFKQTLLVCHKQVKNYVDILAWKKFASRQK